MVIPVLIQLCLKCLCDTQTDMSGSQSVMWVWNLSRQRSKLEIERCGKFSECVWEKNSETNIRSKRLVSTVKHC